MDKVRAKQVQLALKQADDLAINENINCYDVLCYIEDLKQQLASVIKTLNTEKERRGKVAIDENDRIVDFAVYSSDRVLTIPQYRDLFIDKVTKNIIEALFNKDTFVISEGFGYFKISPYLAKSIVDRCNLDLDARRQFLELIYNDEGNMADEYYEVNQLPRF